ncbi:MAG TPA: hypothetical protein PLP75_09945 [Burkholderiales bacterium]|jgi:uncharacterized lipoprotein|nr:hypothetical protein [Burkholderiales bacterium]
MSKKLTLLLMSCVIILAACSDNSTKKFVGTWQDVTESSSSFVIVQAEQGLSLQAPGESSVAVTINGNALTVGDTTLTLDEQKEQLSMSGLFNSQIVFKKVLGVQK